MEFVRLGGRAVGVVSVYKRGCAYVLCVGLTGSQLPGRRWVSGTGAVLVSRGEGKSVGARSCRRGWWAFPDCGGGGAFISFRLVGGRTAVSLGAVGARRARGGTPGLVAG